jgi:hypothetical protein
MKIRVATVLFVGSVALTFVFGLMWQDGYGRLLSWLVVAAATALLAMVMSPGSATTFSDILIDERNRFSQPALLTLCWFVTIVSAYLACAVWNVAIWTPSGTTPLPVQIEIPPTLWVLAGVVGVDVVGTGVVLAAKKQRVPSATHQAEATRDSGSQYLRAHSSFVRIQRRPIPRILSPTTSSRCKTHRISRRFKSCCSRSRLSSSTPLLWAG